MKINSAAGPIDVDSLGKTLMHEHLIVGFPGWESDTAAAPLNRADVIALCVDRVEELKAGGFSSLLDPCPSDLGRDVELYAEVAARTGFNILFATGLYFEKYSSPYWRFKLGMGGEAAVDELTQLYIDEITEGLGPSRLKPAAIKLSVGVDPSSAYENKAIEAAARASLATGAPIITHTEAVAGDIMLAKLVERGVPAHKVIVGHSCCTGDKAYHRSIVDGGAYIGFDRFGATRMQTDETRIDCMQTLLDDGFAQQVIVSHDCVLCSHGRLFPTEYLAKRTPMHFTRNIAPKLREAGVAQSTLDSILRDNPRRYFCEEPPQRVEAASGQRHAEAAV